MNLPRRLPHQALGVPQTCNYASSRKYLRTKLAQIIKHDVSINLAKKYNKNAVINIQLEVREFAHLNVPITC